MRNYDCASARQCRAALTAWAAVAATGETRSAREGSLAACRAGAVLASAAMPLAGKALSPAYDTVRFRLPSDAKSPRAAAPRRADGARASGLVLCYSGQLRGFGAPTSAVLANHRRFVQALGGVPSLRSARVAIVLAAHNATEARALARAHAWDPSARSGLRLDAEATVVQTAPEPALAHPQYAGVAACGRAIRALESAGSRFAYAVRMRYDVVLDEDAVESVPQWPIWAEGGGPQVLALAKQRRDLRCVPQDVFFVARRLDPGDAGEGASTGSPRLALGHEPAEPPRGAEEGDASRSVATFFEGNYSALRRFEPTSDVHDAYEATLFGPALDRGLPLAVVWKPRRNHSRDAAAAASEHYLRCCGKLWTAGELPTSTARLSESGVKARKVEKAAAREHRQTY